MLPIIVQPCRLALLASEWHCIVISRRKGEHAGQLLQATWRVIQLASHWPGDALLNYARPWPAEGGGRPPVVQAACCRGTRSLLSCSALMLQIQCWSAIFWWPTSARIYWKYKSNTVTRSVLKQTICQPVSTMYNLLSATIRKNFLCIQNTY